MPRIVRHAEMEDLDKILEIYETARSFMRSTGNPDQWGNLEPPKEVVVKDIKTGINYVIEENNKVIGVFVFFIGDDPTYSYIEDGSWPNSEPYGVIHRIASDGCSHGIFTTASEFAESQIKNVRIDTAHKNLVMQHVLTSHGYRRCGIIYLENGDPRIAYQKVPEE